MGFLRSWAVPRGYKSNGVGVTSMTTQEGTFQGSSLSRLGMFGGHRDGATKDGGQRLELGTYKNHIV